MIRMERHLVWIWLTLLLVTWGVGLGDFSYVSSIQYLGSAAFFAIIFLIPLFRKNFFATSVVLSAAGIIVTVVFWENASPLTVILFTYLTGEIIYRLKDRHAIITGIVQLISFNLLSPVSYPFSVIYSFFLVIVAFLAYQRLNQLEEADSRYQALLHEYRKIKLKSASDEKLARQEERTHIGREIHDRVGHKLTNLLMQLEVARLEANQDTEERLHMLKDLAKDSLEETRRAVKAMDHDEIGGLSAIIRLIRKLEAENYIRIHFSVKNRAFSAELDVDQTVAVYRAVQEALTNVMRHSSEREATILFESPGESVFRFEVSNPIQEDYQFQVGYGLKSMQKRIENVGGQVDVLTYQNRFILRGTLPIVRMGE